MCELLGAEPGPRAMQFAANQRDTQAVLPRGRFWCRRREAGCEALVSLLGSPHPGPSNAGPEVSLGSPGEPPGSEGPGQAEPHPPALQPCQACMLAAWRGHALPRPRHRGLLAAPLPRPLRTQCHPEPWSHLSALRPKSEMRCLGAEWPGRLLVFCSQGPSETCRTTRPGQSRGAALRGASCPRRPRRQPALRLLDPVLRGPTPGPGPQRPASGRADAGKHGDGSGPCGWVSSSPPFPRQEPGKSVPSSRFPPPRRATRRRAPCSLQRLVLGISQTF